MRERSAPWRSAVVGLGRIGLELDAGHDRNSIFSHCRALSRHSSFELVAGVDVSVEARRRFENLYRCAGYASVEAMYAACRPDFVTIAVPSRWHLPVVRAVVAQRPAAILIEKPVGRNTGECREILTLCRKNRVRAFVNYFRACDPATLEVIRAVRGGALGRLITGQVVYNGGLLNNGAHYLDLLVRIFGVPQAARADWSVHDGGRAVEQAVLDYGSGQIRVSELHGAGYSLGEVDLFFSRNRLCFCDFGEMLRIDEAQPDRHFAGFSRLMPRGGIRQPDWQRYQMWVYDHIAQVLDGRCEALIGLSRAQVIHELIGRMSAPQGVADAIGH